MWIRRLFLIVLICLAGYWLPAKALVLQAHIEHSEKLEPVNQALSPGSVFDMKNLGELPDSSIANQWYLVPGWLAGTWHKDTQTNYYRYDYTTKETDITTHVVEARSDGRWGTQQDEMGRIWQFNPAPFVSSVDGGSELVVQLVSRSDPLDTSDQLFVRRSIDTELRVDKQTNVIKTVECGEQITYYSQESDGLIKRETSSKVFNRFGEPLVLGKSFLYEKRIAPFSPQDTYQGKDMGQLLKQFLAKQSAQDSNNNN